MWQAESRRNELGLPPPRDVGLQEQQLRRGMIPAPCVGLQGCRQKEEGMDDQSCSRSTEDSQARKDSTASRFYSQFHKTSMCTFWLRNSCSRGRNCRYAHGDEDIKPMPDLSSTSMCKVFVATGVCENAECHFAHSVSKLRTTTSFLKTEMCAFYPLGTCRMGQFCRHAHSDSELREEIEKPSEQLESGSPGDKDQEPVAQQREQKAMEMQAREANQHPGDQHFAPRGLEMQFNKANQRQGDQHQLRLKAGREKSWKDKSMYLSDSMETPARTMGKARKDKAVYLSDSVNVTQGYVADQRRVDQQHEQTGMETKFFGISKHPSLFSAPTTLDSLPGCGSSLGSERSWTQAGAISQWHCSPLSRASSKGSCSSVSVSQSGLHSMEPSMDSLPEYSQRRPSMDSFPEYSHAGGLSLDSLPEYSQLGSSLQDYQTQRPMNRWHGFETATPASPKSFSSASFDRQMYVGHPSCPSSLDSLPECFQVGSVPDEMMQPSGWACSEQRPMNRCDSLFEHSQLSSASDEMMQPSGFVKGPSNNNAPMLRQVSDTSSQASMRRQHREGQRCGDVHINVNFSVNSPGPEMHPQSLGCQNSVQVTVDMSQDSEQEFVDSLVSLWRGLHNTKEHSSCHSDGPPPPETLPTRPPRNDHDAMAQLQAKARREAMEEVYED